MKKIKTIGKGESITLEFIGMSETAEDANGNQTARPFYLELSERAGAIHAQRVILGGGIQATNDGTGGITIEAANPRKITTSPKHTPAPWFTDKSRAVYKELPGGVAKVADTRAANGIETDEAHANARLIAAAPDLLAALESLVSADNCNYTRDAMKYEGLFNAARAAIAKAKGE